MSDEKTESPIGKLRQFSDRARYLPWALRQSWDAARGWTLLWGSLLLIEGLLPVGIVYLTRDLVNAISSGVGNGLRWQTARPILASAALFGAVLLLKEVVAAINGWVRVQQGERVQAHLYAQIHRQAATIDMAFYETPDYFDHLHRARFESRTRPLALLEQCGALSKGMVSLISMLVVLLPASTWLPLALVGSTLPTFYVVLLHALRDYRWRRRTTAASRMAQYHDWVLADRSTAPEIRVFGLAGFFSDAFQQTLAGLRRGRAELARKEAIGRVVATLLSLSVTGLALAWMIGRALAGNASLGDLAFFLQAFNQGQLVVRSLLQQAGQLFRNLLYLGDLHTFLNLRPKVEDSPNACAIRPLAKGIEFHQVSFSYPGGKQVLTDLSLSIPPDKMVAIVGPNGAGKSTLIKLIARLYDPTAGHITWDGVDLRETTSRDLRREITVLFQQPAHYNATVTQNIRFGDLSRQVSNAEIGKAAEAAGAAELIESLPCGYETLLGKTFAGGSELSVGQWQRVCLARAIVRNASVILLDEPTSAMDPWTEAHWLERLRQHTKGRCVVLITHRLSTANQADLIFVLKKGKVVRHTEDGPLIV